MTISNINSLNKERERLLGELALSEAKIKTHISAVRTVVEPISDILQLFKTEDNTTQEKSSWLGSGLKIALPILLVSLFNKQATQTILKTAGASIVAFLTKTLLENPDLILEKIKNLFSKNEKQ